jgi:hypothetical protein
MILGGTIGVMAANVFDFHMEPKYTFVGYYDDDNGNEKTFAMKMTIPDAVDFLNGFLYDDTSISTTCGDGLNDAISLTSDLGSVYAECKTKGVIKKIEQEIYRIKNKSNRGYYG